MAKPVLTPTSTTGSTILPATGTHANCTLANLPFGVYAIDGPLYDQNFISGASDQVAHTFRKLGGDVLDIEITIRRNVSHYIYKIILPVFLILCIAWYVLWIPTRKYETRLNTSIIALLALIAYNFVFQDDIPKLNYLTNLDRYILLSYVFCCIPVFISIGSSKLGTKNQKIIIKINKLIRKWGVLAYILITFAIFKLI